MAFARSQTKWQAHPNDKSSDFLRDKGFDSVHAVDGDKKTPLHLAGGSWESIAKQLIIRGPASVLEFDSVKFSI